MAKLPEDLVARLRARAADPDRRSDSFASVRERLQAMSGAPRPAQVAMGDAGGGAFGGLMQAMAGALASGRGFNLQAAAEKAAEDIRAGKTSMEEIFGDAPPGAGIEIHEGEVPDETPGELPAPASQADIAAAEAALGLPLPADLKQLYAGVADGGFGPGDGFLPLAGLVARYRDYRSEPQGPGGETWPAHLMPILPADPGDACYDLETGGIIRWDPEELVEDEADAGAWARSFKPRARSLAEWLERWLGQQSASEQAAGQYRRAVIDSARSAVEALRAMTPEERAEMGLPEEGWEEQICRNHGADPREVLG